MYLARLWKPRGGAAEVFESAVVRLALAFRVIPTCCHVECDSRAFSFWDRSTWAATIEVLEWRSGRG